VKVTGAAGEADTYADTYEVSMRVVTDAAAAATMVG
jgi:hypothetical protein